MIGPIVGAFLLIVGAFITLASAVGLVRFPDTLSRAHALSMGATMGVLFAMLGVALALWDLSAAGKALLTVVFMFLTAPVGSHMLGRAAYLFSKPPVQVKSDELKGQCAELERERG